MAPPIRLIIGLTGPNASGKSALASHLESRDFRLHSLSDIVREEAGARGLDHSRENLIAVGNELRRAEGPGVLAARLGPRIGRRDVVDSIRNPSEVAELRRLEGFHLVGLDAPVELRFQRARQRGRIGDGTTLEEFVRMEESENTSDPAAQQLRATLELADVILLNDGSLASLLERADRLLDQWGGTPSLKRNPRGRR
jgi:dephospho-CoA kinase